MPKTPEAIEEHLRSASDAILLLVGEVEQLERHKRGVQPENPRFGALAKSVRDAATALAEFARAEEQWAREADGARADVLPISEAESPAPLAAILSRWRAIERQLNEATPGSPEAVALFEEFQRVRAEYMAAFAAHQSTDEPHH
jgi:hypothetical protein